MITVNGKSEDIRQGTTLAEYLTEKGYHIQRIAAEKNGQIVPRSEFATVALDDGDVVEIVSFVGGG